MTYSSFAAHFHCIFISMLIFGVDFNKCNLFIRLIMYFLIWLMFFLYTVFNLRSYLFSINWLRGPIVLAVHNTIYNDVLEYVLSK